MGGVSGGDLNMPNLDFFYDGQRAGYFADIDQYPSTPGSYRYVAYRGVGHLRFVEECRHSGQATCTFPGDSGEVVFVASIPAETQVLEIRRVATGHAS